MIKYIGIDIGGTNIRVGAIDENNEIIYVTKTSTLENVTTSEDLKNKIIKMVESVPEYNNAAGIGIGVPGAVQNEKIMTCRNVPMLKGYDIKREIEAYFHISTTIENDAKVATLGEAICGAGINSNTVCYVTISTGLGGGVVMDKKIYRGTTGLAGYFSRMIVDGEHMAEHVLSGTSIKALAGVEHSREVFESDDEKCVEVAKSFKKNLVNLLLNTSITLNPDCIVLGGGVMHSKDLFLSEVIEEFKSKCHSFAVNTQIKEARLSEPGVIGAGLLAKAKYEK